MSVCTCAALGERTATLPPHLIEQVQAKKLAAQGKSLEDGQAGSKKGFSAKRLAQVNANSSQKNMGLQNRASEDGEFSFLHIDYTCNVQPT